MGGTVAEESARGQSGAVRAERTEVVTSQVVAVSLLSQPAGAGSPDVARPTATARREPGWIAGVSPSGDGASFHTLVPRLMVTAALLAAMGSPLFLGTLYRDGHFDIEGNDWYFDERGRSLAVAGLVATVACFCLGWLWWAVAAALNARNRSRYVVSPLFAPITVAVAGWCAYLLPGAIEAQSNAEQAEWKPMVILVALLALPVVAHLAMLTTYSRTAETIGASRVPWILAIVLPGVVVVMNLLSRFFIYAAGDSYATIMGVLNLAFVGVYVFTLYRAMSTFDQACMARRMAISERGGSSEIFSRVR